MSALAGGGAGNRVMADPPVRLLTLTSLFPSAARPRHGIFVETRLTQLVATGRVTAEVVVPVPWFPFTNPRFGRYAELARTPSRDTRSGLSVSYPRYLILPKVGTRWHAHSMAYSVMRHLRGFGRNVEPPDLVDGQYLYPDGAAAAIVAKKLGRPYVLTARGSDVNVLAQDAALQPAILRAIAGAAATITVSGSLRMSLLKLGCDANKITCLRNGVDLDLFQPLERQRARQAIGIAPSYLIASVGNLVAEKRHALVIRALPSLPDAMYVIVGDGPERNTLERLAISLSVRDRVVILPNRSQRELAEIYSAADVVVLPSSREGWPNVVLEALACGTPVVASDVGGVREMITNEAVGMALASPQPSDFSNAILRLLRNPPDRQLIRAHAERFGWDAVVAAQSEIYLRIAANICGAGRSDRRTGATESSVPRGASPSA